VLLSIDQCRKLNGREKSIVEMLAMPGGDQVEFEPPRVLTGLPREIDLS
jgi:hypothetical protein